MHTGLDRENQGSAVLKVLSTTPNGQSVGNTTDEPQPEKHLAILHPRIPYDTGYGDFYFGGYRDHPRCWQGTVSDVRQIIRDGLRVPELGDVQR